MSASSKKKKRKKAPKSKNKCNKKNTFLLIFATILIAIILVVIVFVVDSFSIGKNKLKRNTYFVKEDISFMDKEEFLSHIDSYTKKIFSKKIFLKIDNTDIIVLPGHIGLNIDKNNLWQNAYSVGREESIEKRFYLWLQGFSKKRQIDINSFVDRDIFSSYVLKWEADAYLQKPFEGSVEIKGLDVISELPRNGKKINKEKLLLRILEMFTTKNDKISINAELVEELHKRNSIEIEELSVKAKNFISQPLILANTKFEDISLTLSTNDLADILNISVPKDSEILPQLSIDDLAFAQKLIILQVRDAKFTVAKDYSVEILPGRNGVDVNLEKTRDNLFIEALKSQKGIVHIAINDLIIPDFSNGDAGRLGINHVVSEFTTHHPCCASRVDNIHLIADLLDGTIIRAGEELNINTFIGERTLEKGFKNAGSIFKGEMVDSVGGGISQFMTTLHNALYWGGYEIVKHKPHSIYFSRYPHGIDATINWPYVDYIFKNDTQQAIIIDTEYTDTSLTIRILGNNNGRIITGDHQRWSTPMKVIKSGNNQSRRVVSSVSKAFDFRSPVVRYVSDKSLPRHTPVLIKTGKDGWKTIVDRQVFIGEELYRQDIWPVYYESGKETLYKIHPCDNWNEKSKPKNC